MKRETLKKYISRLQENGRYSFDKQELLTNLDLSADAIRVSLSRLGKQGRVVSVRQGFYVIVPLEYKESGILPPSWFIDHLMRFLGLPYYVGLLSAASLQGAAHQQPQEFQVITTKQVRPIHVKGLTVKFFVKKQMPDQQLLKQYKTETGYMWSSEPELTAFDLLGYLKQAGGMNHVVTVLSELGEIIRPGKLASVAKLCDYQSVAQRLGYILDHIGWNDKTVTLARLVRRRRFPGTFLEPGRGKGNFVFNDKWSLYVNRDIEGDDI